jgi:arylsulfatase A-like enzyme
MSGSRIFVRLVTIVVLTTGWAVTTVPVRAQPSGPNVVIILTADQRATETLQAMPKTTAWLAQGGVQFPNAYATTPLCCPSRAAIMTGQLNHNNGVHRNLDKALLPQGNTIQRILGDAGYATGIAGKYLNGWRQSDGPPPHFDRYSVITRTSTDDEFDADNYTQTTFLEEDSPVEKQVTTYSTDYIAQEAQDFLLDWHADDPSRPWFLYAAPFAPHSPWIPEPAYSAAGVGTWAGNPAVFEADRTDKPPYVRNQAHTFAEGQQIRTQQLRTLLSVDDLVDQVFETIEATGDLGNTVAFFLSDNGFMWGEHGVLSKKVPYTDSIRIPFLVRWPGRLAPGTVDERIVANIDVAPSILDAAGLTSGHAMDGISVASPVSRTKLLTEDWHRTGPARWASVVTARYQYVEYYSIADGVTLEFRELYVLEPDPWQLENVLGNAPHTDDSDGPGLAAELAEARACVGPTCIQAFTSPVALCAGLETMVADHLVGTEGQDTLVGGPVPNLLCGFGGDDELRGGGGPDVILGAEGKDRSVGGPGADVLFVDLGADVLRGNGGRDRLMGGRKADRLAGGGGRDQLRGGAGRDRCAGGGGRDRAAGCEIRASLP